MRYFLFLPILVALAGCAGQASAPVVISDTPKWDYPARPAHHAPRAHDKYEVDVPASAPTDQHDWKIYEDRFITTHSVSTSVEALHLTPDQIQARLNSLDGK